MIPFLQKVKVTRIIDGDTIAINQDDEEFIIRLLGIDTPETHKKNKPNKFYNNEFITDINYLKQYGKKAHQVLANKIFKKKVDLYIDELAPKKGKYNRYLCYVYKGKHDINKYMLYKGLVRTYPSPFTKLSEYGYAEQIAKQKRKGLWDL
jgi:micrococcal nuclease